MATDKLIEWLDIMEQSHATKPTLNVREIAYHTNESPLTVKIMAQAAGWSEVEVGSDLMTFEYERHARYYWEIV